MSFYQICRLHSKTCLLKTHRANQFIRFLGQTTVAALFWASLHVDAGTTELKIQTPPISEGKVLKVGPGRGFSSLSVAAQYVKDGDTIEVDAGDYLGDVAIWSANNLTIRASAGGRVRLLAGGRSAEGKGIWVIRSGSVTVENFDFIGAKVQDKNGAGIRFERGTLIVRNCLFRNNENGILTGNDKDSTLTIENSEFADNGAGDGQSHNLYVGKIAFLKVTGSYFHHANIGHLLKTRASNNHILYNRLTDEPGGRASYELEFPIGGTAYVIGNIIQQNAQTENSTIISFGAEGYEWLENKLYLINNTIADDLPKNGIFLFVKDGSVKIKAFNNLLVGKGSLDSVGAGEIRNNWNVDWDVFVQASRQDYRLPFGTKLRGKVENNIVTNEIVPTPFKEYLHPRQTRNTEGTIVHPGAFQILVKVGQ